MDLDKLVEVLRATLQPTQREEAEQQLNQVHKIIGFCPTLLQVVMSTTIDMPVRQAGAIYLKNMVCQFWEPKEIINPADPVPFSLHENDRSVIRSNAIEAIMSAPEPIRVQLTVCLSNIIKTDYPGRWPDLAQQLALYIQSDRHETWLGALLCLYQLVKNYEYKKGEERDPLNEAMEHILPLLHQRCVQLMSDQSELSALLQKTILKIYFAIIQFSLPLTLVTKEIFMHWMEVSRQIIDRPVPEEGQSQIDEDERPELSWWKCKKWAMHIVVRSFERYGSPGNVMKEYNQFAEWYLKSFASGLIQVQLKVLDQYRRKVYTSPRVLQLALSFLQHGCVHAISWKLIKPHMQGIVQEILFPLMCHNQEDEDLWESDPIEYIRAKYDVFEEYFSPVSSAQVLLQTVASKRKEVLQKTMGFIMQVLNTPGLDSRQKAGALQVIGSLGEVLLKKKIYKSQAEFVLQNHVYPCFQAEEGHLRARACWVLHQFTEVKFANEQNLRQALDLIRNALCNDKEIPVRVEAGIALQLMLADQPLAQPFLKPHVRQIIYDLLTIIRETEIDELTSVMQKIVCMYVDEVMPLAVDITTHLAQTFEKVLKSDPEGTDEKAIAAMGILNTLETIVSVMEDQPEIIAHIEGIVLDVVALILQHNVIEFFEEMLSLVCSLTTQQVSDRMWQVLPHLYNLFKNDNLDYFTDMMPSLHNYVTVAPERFISDPKNIEMVFNMCKTVLTGDSGEDGECHAAKMLEIVILQFKNQLDQQVILSFVELALERLTREVRTSELRTMCLQVVIAALYNEPALLLNALVQRNMPSSDQPILGQFLHQWLTDTDCFLGLHDRKVSVLGLCTLLELPNERRPQPVADKVSDYLPALLMLFTGLQRAYASRAEADKSEESSDGDEEVDHGELEDDDDYIDEENSSYLEHLEKDNDSDSDVDEDMDETLLESYLTILDKDDCPVDEYIIFKHCLQRLEQSDPVWYQALTAPLNEEQRKSLSEVFKLADQRYAAAESKKIELQGGYVFNTTSVPSQFCFGGSAPPQ